MVFKMSKTMAKIYKFSGYFIDCNNDSDGDDIATLLEECNPYGTYQNIEVEERYINDFDDDHVLNSLDCPLSECEKYFKKN